MTSSGWAFPPCRGDLGLRSSGSGTTGTLHERFRGIGWLGAELDPMVNAFDVDDERDGLTAGARVIVAEDFDEATVTADALFGNDEAIGRLVFGTEALEADA